MPVRSEIDRERRILFRRPEPAERYELIKAILVFLTKVHEKGLEIGGQNPSRRDRVDEDVGAGDVQRNGLRECDDRPFRCRVVRTVRAHCRDAVNLGNINNLSLKLCFHELQCCSQRKRPRTARSDLQRQSLLAPDKCGLPGSDRIPLEGILP